MTEEVSNLLALLKTKLRIAYTESDTELALIIANALPDLREKIGPSDIDFQESGAEQSFFLNYCKYAFYGHEDEFFTKYQNEYISLRQKYQVKEETDTEEETETDDET